MMISFFKFSMPHFSMEELEDVEIYESDLDFF